MKALYDYAKSQEDTSGEQEQIKKDLRKIEKKISNIVNAIAGGFDAEELKEEYTSLKGRKTALQSELQTMAETSKTKLSFEEADVLQALQNMRDMVKYPRDEENLKQVYARFIDIIEVHEAMSP